MQNSLEKGQGKFKFAIDRGGTFTDVYALCPDGRERVSKLLSEDPANYPDAPREGIRRILEEVYISLLTIVKTERHVDTFVVGNGHRHAAQSTYRYFEDRLDQDGYNRGHQRSPGTQRRADGFSHHRRIP